MVGCGKMGGALLSRWLSPDGPAFVVADPAGPPSLDVAHVEGPSELDGQCFDLMVAAVKPQLLGQVLPSYAEYLEPDGFVLSMAAGTSASTVSTAAGGAPVIRIMPNLPAAVGQGVSALYAEDRINAEQKELAENFAAAAGRFVWVEDEDGIDRFTAVAGSGPGYVFELLRAYQDAAREAGFDEATSRELVLGTVAGTAAMALEDQRPFAELRDDVTSPNGTTQAGLTAMGEGGVLEDRLRSAVRAAYNRAVELR
ncbi:pyrroline-5-carboxylate reductase [Parvularcula sp. BGMRC 0090]|uniref:Pyrroline-5-carboxylate reductase n=2 Tax=Parvularcula maris TaxID=2965077 RepID=A0A9X2RL47_9PROT|nr:pyrroline-5-carboxylate reductase [Parvularcula maris]